MLWTFKKTQKSFKKSIKLMFMTTKITKNTKKTRKAGKIRDFCLFGRLKKPQKTRKNTKNGENPCFLSLWTSQKTTKIRKAGKMRDFCLFGRPKNREIPRKMGKNRQNPVKNRQFWPEVPIFSQNWRKKRQKSRKGACLKAKWRFFVKKRVFWRFWPPQGGVPPPSRGGVPGFWRSKSI